MSESLQQPAPQAPGGNALTAPSPVITEFSTAANQQVVAMLGEDTRAFLQSMEQIYIAAAAKGLAMVAVPATQTSGETLLTQIAASQTATVTFSQAIAATAAQFAALSA